MVIRCPIPSEVQCFRRSEPRLEFDLLNALCFVHQPLLLGNKMACASF